MAAAPWLLLLAAGRLAGQGLEDGGPLGTVEVATLGRAIHLGGLYSSHRGHFLPASGLWNTSIIQDTKVSTWRPSSDVQFSMDGDDMGLLKHLNIDATISMSLLAGFLKVSGSGSYLTKSTSREDFAQVRMSFMCSARSEALGSQLAEEEPEGCRHLDTRDPMAPTHVVSQITYGGDVHFVFKQKIKNYFDSKRVWGELEFVMNFLFFKTRWTVNLIDESSTSISKLTDIDIKVFSDFVLDHQPSNLSDVLELYQDINKLLGDKNEMYQKAVPVKALLVPINKFCSNVSEPTQTIDKEVLTEALSVKLKLEEVVKQISMLKNTYAATFDEGVSKKLNGYVVNINKYLSSFESNLTNAWNKLDSEGLKSLTASYKASCYSYDTFLHAFMDKISREVNVLNYFYGEVMTSEALHLITSSKPVSSFLIEKQNVFVLDLRVLTKEDKRSFEDELCPEEPSPDVAWYSRRPLAGTVGRAWRAFREFAGANYRRTPAGNNSAYVVNIRKAGELNETPASLSLYTEGFSAAEFEAPSRFTQQVDICRKQRGKLTMFVANPATTSGAGRVTKVRVNFTRADPDPFATWQSRETRLADGETTKVVIENIDSLESYKLRLAYVTEYGSGAASQLVHSWGPLTDMRTRRGCIVKTHKRYSSLQLIGYDLTVSQCAGQALVRETQNNQSSPVLWNYDTATENCYVFKESNESKFLNLTGWVYGSPGCGTGQIGCQEVQNVNCKEQGNVIETQYFDDLELCKQECLKLPLCQGFAAHVAGNCTFLRDIYLQRCSIDKALSLYMPDGASVSSGWSPWSPWSSTCSSSLTRARSRRCLRWGCSQPCQGHSAQEKDCSLQQQLINPTNLTNLTLWASDSSHPAQPGLIRSVSVEAVSGPGWAQVLARPQDHLLELNSPLASHLALGTQWRSVHEIRPTQYLPSNCSSLSFSAGHGPAALRIVFAPLAMVVTVGEVELAFYEKPPLEKWTRIEVQQTMDGGGHFTVTVTLTPAGA